MNELVSIVQQGQQFFVQHAPAEMLTRAIPAGLALLVVGIGLSVLGAKFARFGLTGAAVILGGWAGMSFGQANGFPPILCVMIGALLVGIIGYQTFRVWVGLGTAAVVTLIAFSVFGHQEIRPYVSEFDQNNPSAAVAAPGSTEFTLPSAVDQQGYLERRPEQWAGQFWSYLEARDPGVTQNARGLFAVALLSGLCVGLLATRWALILSTSLIGTLLVVIGAATVLVKSVPDSLAAFDKNPGLAAAGIAGFLITSLILQSLLSRKVAEEKTA